MKKLNVGCGTDIRNGWINLDVVELLGVDVVWDIERTPYPFDSNSIDEILCQDVLEHVDFIKVLEELHRIAKPGCKIHIQVPHFTAINNYLDPTHKHRFSVDTFDFFLSNHERNYYFKFGFSSIEKKLITFNYIFKPLVFVVNAHSIFQKLYERLGICNVLVGYNVNVTLVK